MNVAGMAVMVLFMVMLMMDPGGEMMRDMARRGMRTAGVGAFQMGMPPGGPADQALLYPDDDGEDAAQQITGGTTMSDSYTCPMHPEVKRKSPGKCPKCGMELVLTGRSKDEDRSDQPEEQRESSEQPSETAALVLRLDPAALTYKGRSFTEWLDRLERVLEKMEGVEAQGRSGASSDVAGAARKYSCPMHPEVVRDQPGKCPKCGMDLEPQGKRAPTAEGDPGHSEGHPKDDHEQHESMEGHQKMMVGMAMSTAQTRWALPISLVLAVVVSVVVARPVWHVASAVPNKDAVLEVGTLLLSRYMIAFEGAAMLILAGIVTAVMMGRRERSDIAKAQSAPPVVLEMAKTGGVDKG